ARRGPQAMSPMINAARLITISTGSTRTSGDVSHDQSGRVVLAHPDGAAAAGRHVANGGRAKRLQGDRPPWRRGGPMQGAGSKVPKRAVQRARALGRGTAAAALDPGRPAGSQR